MPRARPHRWGRGARACAPLASPLSTPASPSLVPLLRGLAADAEPAPDFTPRRAAGASCDHSLRFPCDHGGSQATQRFEQLQGVGGGVNPPCQPCHTWLAKAHKTAPGRDDSRVPGAGACRHRVVARAGAGHWCGGLVRPRPAHLRDRQEHGSDGLRCSHLPANRHAPGHPGTSAPSRPRTPSWPLSYPTGTSRHPDDAGDATTPPRHDVVPLAGAPTPLGGVRVCGCAVRTTLCFGARLLHAGPVGMALLRSLAAHSEPATDLSPGRAGRTSGRDGLRLLGEHGPSEMSKGFENLQGAGSCVNLACQVCQRLLPLVGCHARECACCPRRRIGPEHGSAPAASGGCQLV